jgi:transcriptional regulator
MSLEDLRIKIIALLATGLKQVQVANKLHMSRARVHYILNLDEYRAYHAAYSKGRSDKIVESTRKPCRCTKCGELGHNSRRCML